MIIHDLYESPQLCPECGGISFSDLILAEKKDACYYKVKASAKVWPSAYASGRLVQCRKKGADSYGNKSEGVAEGSLNEGLAHPVIVVDVQPEYSGMNDGDESAVFPQIINFVNKQTGPVLMFVNAEDQGLSGDTVAEIQTYWEDTIDPDWYDNDPDTNPINWSRFQIVDKGYGYFRGWMDAGIEPSTIIATIRELYQQHKNNSRELQFPPFNKRTTQQSLIQGAMEELNDEPLSVNWTSVAQLKRFNGAYLVGGARDQCLREVELLMNAFNIKYKRIDSLIYEGQQGVAEGQLDEKSVSQAQFRTMAAAAHNPKFAKKVGISQDVAQEFNKADKGQDYKKLPARTTEESERGRGRPTTGEWDPTSGKVGRTEKTPTGVRHHADPSRYGGTEPDPEFDTLNKNTINAMDRALGVKWDRESKKYFSPLKVDMDEGEQQKGADYRDPPEADYGDDYQAMVARVKKLAGLGPLKTVYDPNKRVYRNVPTAVQPKK